MSKKIRDYLFYIFIILFVFGTLITSLYASGFRINFNWPLNFNNLLVRTGIIVVKTKPEGATIYLNNRPQSNFSLNPWKKEYLTSNAKIKNILPGEYNLNLKLPGYWPLNKQIKVYSGQTTFLENINLFRSDLPQLVSKANDSQMKVSSNYRYLYLAQDAKIIDLQTEQSVVIPKLLLSNNPSGIWLKNKDQLFINGQIFSNQGQQINDYRQLLGPNARNWYYDQNQDCLYYQNNDSLDYLNLSNETKTTILQGKIYLDYRLQGNNLLLIVVKNKQTILQIYSLETKKIEQEIQLPPTGHYIFSPGNHSWITLYDSQNKTLYLINPSDITRNTRIIRNVISWQWANNQTLFYNNDWEIYRFDLSQNSSTLLIRVSHKINKILWNKNNKYLIFSTTKTLNTYDPKIKLNTKIFTASKIASPQLNEINNTLYFWAKVGNQTGIYSLLLQ